MERVRYFRPKGIAGLEIVQIEDTRRAWEGVMDRFVVSIASDPRKNRATSIYRRKRHDGAILSGVSPGEAHRAVPFEACSWSIVQLDPAAYAALAPERNSPQDGFRHHAYDDPAAYEAFRRAHRAFAVGEAPITTETLLRDALALMLRNDQRGPRRTSSSAVPATISRARELLHDRYRDDLSVQELADACGLSREHLLRSFRQHYGVPPHRYLMYLRVSRARDLLLAGSPASAIASEVGFYDHSHMNRWFRRTLGVAPSVYVSGS